MKTNVACKQCVQKDDARGYKTTHTNSGLLLWLKSEVSLTLTSIGGTYEESK